MNSKLHFNILFIMKVNKKVQYKALKKNSFQVYKSIRQICFTNLLRLFI